MFSMLSLEERELYGSVASLLLIVWNVDALGYVVVCLLAKRASMIELLDAVEAVGGHLIG